VAIAVYGWMNLFLLEQVPTSAISLPWSVAWPLPAGSLQMMFLYAIMALPATLVASNLLKLWRFRNFDPKAELKPVPTVADLIARAEGDKDDEDTVRKEGDKARRRLRGEPLADDEEEATSIEDADEDDVEIVDPEAGPGKGKAGGRAAASGALVAGLADRAAGASGQGDEE
jgi:hypothetical protein